MHSVDTIWSAFERTCERFAASDAFHVPLAACRGYSTEPITLTYAAAQREAGTLAARFATAGYGTGHRIGVALDNRVEFFLVFLALSRQGCSIVPLNAAMSVEELAYILDHADVNLIVTHAGHTRHLTAAAPPGVAVTMLDGTVAIDPPAGGPHAGRDEAALLYTSGTTGKPKGCVLPVEYFRQIGALYTSLGGLCGFKEGSDRLMTPLPVTHMNALGCSFMAMLLTGGCLVQLDRFHPTTWWQSLRESRATCFHYLGVMPAMLLGAPPTPADDLSGRVRFGFGAGVDPRHQAAFEQRFGVPLVEAWAMTETGGGGWITANLEPRHVGMRCFGRPPAGLAVRIVDEAGGDVAAGIPGELLVRRSDGDPRRGFFAGYYKDPAATAAAWAGGWFHTGDIVRADAEGALYFVDRSKNVVRRSGENIAAVEVESVLLTHAAVGGCAITPVADDIRGEEVFAFIVPAPGATPTTALAAELQAHCLAALAYYKAPGYVAFVGQLPQTASQKLARGEIKKLAAATVESGRALDLRPGKKRPATGRG